MITLFRRLRQQLIDSGSITKYLLYAVGEILLVVIGILVALQVNNWNEGKSLEAQEKVYLGLILDDLILQKEENDIHRTAIVNHISVEGQLTDLVSNRFQVRDDQRYEAKTALNALLVGRSLGAYEATFIDLTSSGNIGLISNQMLKNQIIQHYQIQKRDQVVINKNSRTNDFELWLQLVERDLILISTNLAQVVLNNNQMEFDASFNFLDDMLFENLSKDENLILIQNVMAHKIVTTGVARHFLDNSDERIDRLMEAIEVQIENI